MGTLQIEPARFNRPLEFPPWEKRYVDALEKYGRIRDENKRKYRGDGADFEAWMNDGGDLAELDAMEEAAAAEVQAGDDFLFGFEKAIEHHPERTRNLLLSIVAEPIADAVMEAVKR